MISSQKKNILGVDDDDYLEHGEREKNFLDVVMNIDHCTSEMKVITFQVQEHGIQHGEENIFLNGSILFLPHITWIHAKSFVQVNQRHTTNKTS